MSDFKERLKVEYDELTERHVKLAEFLVSGKADALSNGNRSLLGMQLSAMQDYITILEIRLELLKG